MGPLMLASPGVNIPLPMVAKLKIPPPFFLAISEIFREFMVCLTFYKYLLGKCSSALWTLLFEIASLQGQSLWEEASAWKYYIIERQINVESDF